MTAIKKNTEIYDLICAGAGIMSGTLALMLKLIDPDRKILVFEQLDDVARESSAAWNNSGTGHSGFCELNYTPEQEDGSIDISKALDTFTQFERSKQFWAFLVDKGLFGKPYDFIRPVPHHSWVHREADNVFLKKRFEAMQEHLAFDSMKFSDDPDTLAKWFPLIMQDRDKKEQLAATRMERGTEIDFGTTTRNCFKILDLKFDCTVKTGLEVMDIRHEQEDKWQVRVKDMKSDEKQVFYTRKVFIGAGGGALPLLQDSGIEAESGYGGFPVSGEWLVCRNRSIAMKHNAKVYSKAGVNAPPMAAPHLDTRYIDGRQELMFGPFAGFSTKFLKKGSYLDLSESIEWDNIPSYWGAFWKNLDLTEYLIKQLAMGHEDRVKELREFVPGARPEDWELRVAGQRVQVIKRDPDKGGILEFGTDIVHNRNGSFNALLGASPGASTAVDIMTRVIKLAFPEEIESDAWKSRLAEMIPFWKSEMDDDQQEFKKVSDRCDTVLRLKQTPQ